MGLLDVEEITKPADLAACGGVWFCKGRRAAPRERRGRFQPGAHPAFVVDGLAILVVRLASKGVAVAHDEPLDDYDRVFVDDPFGNRIELIQPHVRR